jgi:uncharacterized protein (TIGR03086 family)
VERLVEHHRRACDEFLRVAHAVPDDGWSAPTPCTEWDARAVVEHVVGFHEWLLLRPLRVRANRPREGPAARWQATANALFDALAVEGALDRQTELPGGGTSTPRTMLSALTSDVVVHTWDLGVATGVAVELDADLCADSLARLGGSMPPSDMYAPAVVVAPGADPTTRLIAACGRDPKWTRLAP